MSIHRVLATLFSLVAVAWAWDAPQYTGYTRVWQSNFVGRSGPIPASSGWTTINKGQNYNNELSTYTNSINNVRLSGSGTAQLVPVYNAASKAWTSGRIDSSYTFIPKAGKLTRVEASLRLGSNAQAKKQGIWPAFWMLGDSYRHGTAWPACGEIDVMEQINGEVVGHGAMHCDVYPAGRCNEGTGIGSATTLPNDYKYHVWRVELDRKSANFKDQSVTWFMDGKQFHRVTGQQIGSSTVWASLCQKPLYFILNVAVGGNWPGYPNSNTLGGAGSSMEIGYVAHYETK